MGTISVLEVTWSRLNHWHPHSHELIFSMQHRSTMNSAAYEAEIRVAWERAAAREGLHMNEHGFRLDKTFGAVADYVAKFGRLPLGKPWGVESEMTKGHLKQGKGPVEHLTPFGLLYHINQGHEQLIPVCRDYARWFKGKHQLTWSSGLRAFLLGSEEAVLLGLLTRAQWRVVLANDARGELLEVARSGKWELVRDFLVGIGCVLPESGPRGGSGRS